MTYFKKTPKEWRFQIPASNPPIFYFWYQQFKEQKKKKEKKKQIHASKVKFNRRKPLNSHWDLFWLPLPGHSQVPLWRMWRNMVQHLLLKYLQIQPFHLLLWLVHRYIWTICFGRNRKCRSSSVRGGCHLLGNKLVNGTKRRVPRWMKTECNRYP